MKTRRYSEARIFRVLQEVDADCLPLWFGQNYILVKPYVKGYELNPMSITDLSKVSVE